MRKNFFFLCLLICGTITAQIEKTFNPEEGKTYVITHQQQSQSSTFGRYLAENPDTKTFVYEEATSEYTKWIVEYTTNGYTFKNAKTGNYFTYVGEVDFNGEMQWGNSIDLSSSTVNAEKCYFKMQEAPNLFSLGSDSYTFTAQGYGIIGTVGGRGLNSFAYEDGGRWIGSWEYEGNDNENWLILDEQNQANFEQGIKATKYSFMPQENAVYYIKNRELMESNTYLVNEGNALFMDPIEDKNLSTSSYAQWTIILDEANEGYLFRNVMTDKYMRYDVADAEDGIITDVQIGELTPYLFTLPINSATIQDTPYVYTNASTGESFTIQDYHIVSKVADQALDSYGDGVIGTWQNNTYNTTNQRWIILSEEQLQAFNNILGGGTDVAELQADQAIKVTITGNEIQITGTTGINSVNIFDTFGNNVASRSYNTPVEEAALNVSASLKGIYLVKVGTADGASSVVKFVLR